MTPTALLGLSVAAVLGVAVYAIRRIARHTRAGRQMDFGTVSTQWLAELRRDEPWTRS